MDESGDLGSAGSEYFAMAALILMRPRHLKSVLGVFPKDGYEHKWSNSTSTERIRVFEEIKRCQFRTVTSVINKNNPYSKRHLYGNDLYCWMLRQVITDAISVRMCNDVNVYIDRCRFIKENDLHSMIKQIASDLGANVLDCGKRDSHQTPCLQVVDFIAGATRAKHEGNDSTLSLIDEKISIARRY